jgi:AbrB family looped-hinge helix DNA binding protein
MPISFQMTLRKTGHSLAVTIPDPIVQGLNLKEGDTMLVTLSEKDEIIIRKKGK